jgi:hypothetical protein
MSLEALLLILRIAAALLLLAFVGALFVMMWRDYHAVSLEVVSRTRKRGRLVVVNSDNGDGTPVKQGMTFPLLPLTSLGRAPTNTIVLNDTFTSNEHALVTLRSGQWWLEDRNSSNGTLLNGYRIQEPVVVSAGDVIAVGRVELKLELD